ncbi:Helicase associated domain protein [Pseudobutyrivibrio xylanivorans]|uniref:Uncharacterized protein n=1 Tax=Pseudobutyrivibrio xylanivorans TaxID=185007 RepID=A0A5P6VT32_PSEXY|nr:Helicase associated domain protein [Pseudobutyrivibrio xylanivorans]QFJ55865.1 hypothetical protein FXF36_13710 [Pseudobutyrivibrio xylanivorans]
MAIELYAHNRDAYQAAIAMLKIAGKAAIIHPTGTGKSFIGFKLCEDNPDKHICWLSPSKYIFSTQLENLRKECGLENETDSFLTNITFVTYARLMNMSDEEMQAIAPDYIVLDEFHRCGAVEWGRGIERFLSIHQNIPMLGLSATAIRYLDNQRDMSDELFDGHVASEMSLGESIVRGILNPPKYVLSLYSYQEELNKYGTRARRSKSKVVRDKAEEYIDQLRRALNKAEGLDKIFEKHMSDKTGKYIVFCSNFEAMQDALEKVPSWFSLVDKNPHVYSVYSDDPTASVAFKEFKEDEDESHLRLLLCIDALNEGVHVDDISGVILLRPTVSPIIYKQQIGRALSASKKKDTVIFDIVNNIQNLYSIDVIKEEMTNAMQHFRSEASEDSIVNTNFEVIAEVSNCLELFRQLEDTLNAGWDFMYQEAKKYFDQNGNLMVPASYISEDGYGLGRWIRTQRIARQNKDADCEEKYVYGYCPITDEHVKMLDEIGMIWNSVIKENWIFNFRLAKEFYQKNGHLIVPHDYVVRSDEDDSNDIKLGIWITSQRTSFAKGRLSEEQIKLMEQIGMSWDRYDEKWQKGFQYCKRYKKEYGDINFVPADFEYEGFKLQRWLNTQRSRCKLGKLSEERIKKLQELGFKLSVHEAFWESGFVHAAEYKKQHGDLNVPNGYVCSDGFKLKSWLTNQKARCKKGMLSEGQVGRLKAIGGV